MIQRYFIPFVCILFVIGAFQVGKGVGTRSVAPQIVKEYEDRYITKWDTVKIVEHSIETQFKTLTVTETRVDTVRIPPDFDYKAVVGANPITQRGRSYVHTSYDLNRQAFVQRTFEIEDRKLQWTVMPSVSHESASLTINLTYRRVGFQVATIQSFSGSYLYHAGIGYRFGA